MNEDARYWIGFNHVKGIGAARLRALLDYFGSARLAWDAPPEELRAAGLSAALAAQVANARKTIRLDDILERMEKAGIRALTWDDPAYPSRLKSIAQPPPVLYVRGEWRDEDEWAIAIVGTRRVTAYGRQVAEETASFLAQNGATIVSGLARGVDGIAHKAALQAGGRTVAVLGSGVDVLYPPEHRALAEKIIENGALISDYPPGTPPESSNFPPRNRIISGLSLAVVVVEAGTTSGALITAEFAAEQGREVFAVPGNIFAPQSKGTNRLLRDGAHPMLEPKDILETLNLTQIHEHRAAQRALPANETELRLLQTLGAEPLHVDELRRELQLPVAEVSAALTMMELKGMVRHVGGMRYVALREVRAVYGKNDELP